MHKNVLPPIYVRDAKNNKVIEDKKPPESIYMEVGFDEPQTIKVGSTF